jgi:pheromone shutdown protein TraB
MSTSTYLVSAFVMGALVVGAAVLVSVGREWRQYKVRDDPERPNLLGRLATDTGVWKLIYLALTLLGIAVTIFALANGNAALFVLSLGAGFAGFLGVSVYMLATASGHPHSHAVGEAVAVMAGLGLLVVVGWLLFTAGA